MAEEDRSIRYLLQITSKSMIKKRKWALEERIKGEGPHQALVAYEEIMERKKIRLKNKGKTECLCGRNIEI